VQSDIQRRASSAESVKKPVDLVATEGVDYDDRTKAKSPELSDRPGGEAEELDVLGLVGPVDTLAP
jgi:hypothetical protein